MSSNQVTLVRKKKPKKASRPKNKVTRLAKDVAMLKKELISDVERKNLYISFAATQIDNNGTMSAVANSIIQGDGIYERIGRAVKCSGIDFRYHLTANSPTVAAAMRVIVILDKTILLAHQRIFSMLILHLRSVTLEHVCPIIIGTIVKHSLSSMTRCMILIMLLVTFKSTKELVSEKTTLLSLWMIQP